MAGPPSISIAIPLYNEESVIPQLLERTRAVLDQQPGGPHEIVCIDDGSNDRTLEILAEAVAKHPQIVAICLSRNFGQQVAYSAALQHASGDVVVLMDGDLQDPPEAIPSMLELYQQGYDVVYAVRVNRKEGVLLKACYYLFYRLISLLSEVVLPRDAGDFCLVSRRVVDELLSFPEQHRYLRGLRSWVGFRQIGVEVERSIRAAGKRKYSLCQLMKLGFDGIFAFSVWPLRAATFVGAATLVSTSGFAIYSIYKKLVLGTPPQGFTALIVCITFLAGVQLLFLGVVGEYIGRIYHEVKSRPLYLLKQIIRNPRSGQLHARAEISRSSETVRFSSLKKE